MRAFLIALAAVAVPTAAFAQTLGCYIDQLSFPNCSTAQINCSGNTALNNLQYGFSLGALCNNLQAVAADALNQGAARRQAENSLATCAASLSSANGQISLYDRALTESQGNYNSLLSACEANEANRQEWITYGKNVAAELDKQKMLAQQLTSYGNGRAALAKRLKRLCGKPCAKIRV